MEEEIAEQLDEQFSEDEGQTRSAHKKMLGAVTQLYDKKRVKAPTRKEPSLEVSEFHLSLPDKKRTSRVKVTDLAKVLNKRSVHADISHKLKAASKRAKTLPKPLEKIHADQITRAAGYEHARQQLNRWDSIVYKQKVADQLRFPLKSDTVKVHATNDVSKLFRKPTELELKLAEILNHPDPLEGKKKEEKENMALESTEDYPLSLAEIIEKRKMMAKLKAKESYRQAKAARHKKIKSKKFRQIQRKARTKEQLKEFEELQKKDPEAALRKLEELERARAEERVSLRHRSTGQWAKNFAVRAKYDKEARIALSEQLSKSRELTVKLAQNRDSESEKEDEEEPLPQPEEKDPNNPWVVKRTDEMTEFLSGYRKYWETKGKENGENVINDTAVKVDIKPVEKKKFDEKDNLLPPENKKNSCIEINENTNIKVPCNSVSRNKFTVIDAGSTNEGNKNNAGLCNSQFKCTQNRNKEKVRKKSTTEKFVESKSSQLVNKTNPNCTSGSWIVGKASNSSLKVGGNVKNKQSVDTFKITKTKNVTQPLLLKDLPQTSKQVPKEKNLDELFEEVEDNLQSCVRKKVEQLKRKLTVKRKSDEEDSAESEREEETPSLEMKKAKIVADVDEELLEQPDNNLERTKSNDVLEKIKTNASAEVKEADNIDPKNFLKVTQKHLNSKLPDHMTEGDNLDDEEDAEKQRHLTLSEAFAEDDIVDEFNKEKEDEVKKNKIDNVDLSLPGWGSWAGHNMKPISRRKRKKFVIKFPKAIPRRDSNRGNVIINEDADKPIKEHQVSEIPFPFTSVKEFEASIRAPLGTTWLSHSAHKKLTMPQIVTKKGAIIEPMDDSQLISQEKKGPKRPNKKKRIS